MAGRFCLDTNIAVAYLNGEEALLTHVKDADEIWLAPIVFGELLFGAAKSTRAKENKERIVRLIEDFELLPWIQDVGHRFADVKLELKRKGKPIPENDLWIAAFALASKLPLVTRDAHFDEIEQLTVERW